MSVEVGTAYLTVIPSARGFAGRIRSQIGGDMETAGREGGQRMHGGMLGAVAGTGAALGAAVVAGGVAIAAIGAIGLKAGLDTARGMETAKISFTTMLGSGEKADAFLKQLSDFAAKTPFEFPELQTAASSLISAGFEAGKVIPIMTTLGDVTSGMGTGSEGVQRATVALQQMSAAGKITGEDLNQLRDAGVPVFDLLSAATGKTKEQISDLAQKGKLGKKEMQQLFDALGSGKGLERFKGLMDKQSQSLDGMISTAKDTLNMGLANAVQPLIPLIKDGLGKAADFAAAAMPVLANGLKSVIEGIQSFATMAGPAFSSFGEILSPLVDTVKLFFGTLSGQGADVDLPWMNLVIDLAGGVSNAIDTVRTGFSAFFSALAEGDVTSDGVVGMFERVGDTIRSLSLGFSAFFFALAEGDVTSDGLVGKFEMVGAFLHDNLPAAIATAQSVFQGFASFVTSQLIPRIMGIVEAISGFVAVALPIVIQFVTGMRDRIAPLMPQVRLIFTTIGVIIAGALEGIRSVITVVTSVIAFIWRNWGQNIMDFVAVVFKAMLSNIQAALNVIMAVVRTFVAIFHGDWKGAWDGVRAILSTSWELIKSVINNSLNIIKAALSLAWSVILTGLRAAWGLITGAVSDAWNRMVATVSGKLGEIKKWISDAWATIRTGAVGAWNGIVSAVGGALGGLWNAVTAPFRTVLTWIKDHFVTPLNDMLSKVGVSFRIPFPSFSNGGPVAARPNKGSAAFGFADGGYTGGGRKYQPAGIVHAGEVVFSQSDVARHGGVSMVEQMRLAGLPGHADGGIVGAIKGAAGAVGGFVGDVVSVLSDPIGAVKKLVGNILGGIGGSLPAQIARGALERVGGGLADKVKSMLASVMGGGLGAAVPLGGGLVSIGGGRLDATTAGIFQRSSAILGGLRLMQGSFSTSVGASGGTHSGTGAMDVWPANGDWKRAVDVIRSQGGIAWHRTPSQGPWAEHIHSITPGISGLSPSAAAQVANFRAGLNGLTSNGPDNHGYFGGGPVTPLLFDSGGYLPTGASVVVNKTGAPEPLRRVGNEPASVVNFNGSVGADAQEVVRIIDTRRRDSATRQQLAGII